MSALWKGIELHPSTPKALGRSAVAYSTGVPEVLGGSHETAEYRLVWSTHSTTPQCFGALIPSAPRYSFRVLHRTQLEFLQVLMTSAARDSSRAPEHSSYIPPHSCNKMSYLLSMYVTDYIISGRKQTLKCVGKNSGAARHKDYVVWGKEPSALLLGPLGAGAVPRGRGGALCEAAPRVTGDEQRRAGEGSERVEMGPETPGRSAWGATQTTTQSESSSRWVATQARAPRRGTTPHTRARAMSDCN
ncbi:hypothetical protein B0H14DRAFT_3127029 [Mycena olivaceomarginata]|nr:hypothetical protein B0H14DRAFT_3127029 [Mycena olivaceomarginata]